MRLIKVGIVLVVVMFCYAVYSTQKEEQEQQYTKNLGLVGATKEMVKKHIWIAQRCPDVSVRPHLVPAHIVFRANALSPWKLIGSATILRDHPGHFVSAYHVFSVSKQGQYGIRKITRKCLTGEEKIIPIISLHPNKDTDDDIVGKFATDNSVAFPNLAVARIEKKQPTTYATAQVLNGLEHRDLYIRILAYPDKKIRVSKSYEIRPGTRYYIFDEYPEPSESGEGGFFEPSNPNELFIVVQHTVVVDDDGKEKKVGIGHTIQIN